MSNIGLTEWEVNEIRKESNNPPDKVVELTNEQYEFLLRNCEANIAFGLMQLQYVDHNPTAEKLVAVLEQFKSAKKALENAK